MKFCTMLNIHLWISWNKVLWWSTGFFGDWRSKPHMN